MVNTHTLVQPLGPGVLVARISHQAAVALSLHVGRLAEAKAIALEIPADALPGGSNLLAEFIGEQVDTIPHLVWSRWPSHADAGQDALDVTPTHLTFRVCASGAIEADTSAGRQRIISPNHLAAMSGIEALDARNFAAVSDPVPVLSTSHLTAQQRRDLDEGGELPGVLTLYSDASGWMLYCHPELDGPELPENLGAIFAWAHALKTPYLRFDSDGGEIAGLPAYPDMDHDSDLDGGAW